MQKTKKQKLNWDSALYGCVTCDDILLRIIRSAPHQALLVLVVLLVFLFETQPFAFSKSNSRDRVVIKRSSDLVSIENTRVRVMYRLSSGKYDAVDKVSVTSALVGAYTQIGDWTSTMPGATHHVEVRNSQQNDPLGNGKTLSIERMLPDAPTIVLEISLYESRSFISLFNRQAGNITRVSQKIFARNIPT